MQLQIHYNRNNNDWKIKIYLQRLKTFSVNDCYLYFTQFLASIGVCHSILQLMSKIKVALCLKKKSSINIYSEKEVTQFSHSAKLRPTK